MREIPTKPSTEGHQPSIPKYPGMRSKSLRGRWVDGDRMTGLRELSWSRRQPVQMTRMHSADGNATEAHEGSPDTINHFQPSSGWRT